FNESVGTSHSKEEEVWNLTSTEEEEHLRKRKSELEKEIIRLYQDNDQYDDTNGRYNREFFYNTREYDKLFNSVTFPAPLKELGVCKSLVGLEPNKKLFGKAKFKPDYCNFAKSSSYQGRHPIRVRAAAGGGQVGAVDGWYSDVMLTVVNSNVQLHKAENPWKAGRIEVDDGTEVFAKKALFKRVRSILNRITRTTKSFMKVEFLALNVHESPFLNEVVAFIFEKAITEPMYGPLYASLCTTQNKGAPDSNVSQFRKVLRQRAKQIFEYGDDYFVEK
ncbi:hypothetical protein PFISCL1PPCAC_11784, partial [Pristionchus fissidentatus]